MNIPFDLTIFELVFIASLLFIASSIQGLLGYGFAVISSPILVQIDPVLVPALLSLLAFPLTIKIFTRERSQVIWSPMKYLLIGRLAGGPLGLICLIYLEQRILSITVGAIVLFAGLASYFGWTLERNFRNSFNAGMFSGIFAMIAGVGGPPTSLPINKYFIGDHITCDRSLLNIFIVRGKANKLSKAGTSTGSICTRIGEDITAKP